MKYLFQLAAFLLAPVCFAAPDADFDALKSGNAEFREFISEYSASELEQEVYELPIVEVETDASAEEKDANNFELEPVSSTTTLRLLGRGIKPRGGQESLALACYTPQNPKFEIVDANCPAIRYVWFRSAGEAYYIGSSMAMPSAPTPKLKKKALKVVLADYFNHHQTKASEAKVNRHITRSFILIVTATALVALNLPMTAAGAVIGGWSQVWKVFAVAIGGYLLMTNVSVMNYLVSGTLLEAKFTQADGWNWADRAKPIGKNNYRVLLGQITKGTRFERGHYNRDGKVDRQYFRLQRKGVDFPEHLGLL